MQAPTIREEGGVLVFEWGAGLVIEVPRVKRTRWGNELDVRVLDNSQEDSPLMASATVRLSDLRDRERFCQALQRRDGQVQDWEARLLLVADHIAQNAPVGGGAKPVAVRLADVEREEVSWLWQGRLPLGKLTIVQGDPGTGKSWLTCAIGAAITSGAPLPGETESRPPANMLLLSAEDGPGDTIRPRMEDMGADLTRVTILKAVQDEEDGQERHVSLVHDLPALEEVLAGGEFRYVVIDPLNAYLGGTLDTYRDAAVRSVLTPLAALAEKYQAAMPGILHLTKGSRDKPIYRGQGSIAYTAAARVVLLVGKNPENEAEKVVVGIKNNLGPEASALAFTVSDGQFRWLGETDIKPAALLAPDQDGDEESALQEARDFLRETLADDQRPSKEVERQADALGISHRTLRRARKAEGVEAIPVRKQGEKGVQRWDWGLSGGLGGQGGQVKEVGPLNPDSYLEGAQGEEGLGHLNPELRASV